MLIAAEENMYTEKTINKNQIINEEVDEIINILHKNNKNEKTHSENVSMLCEKIAKELNFTDDDIRKIKDAAYYHDIGKYSSPKESA